MVRGGWWQAVTGGGERDGISWLGLGRRTERQRGGKGRSVIGTPKGRTVACHDAVGR